MAGPTELVVGDSVRTVVTLHTDGAVVERHFALTGAAGGGGEAADSQQQLYTISCIPEAAQDLEVTAAAEGVFVHDLCVERDVPVLRKDFGDGAGRERHARVVELLAALRTLQRRAKRCEAEREQLLAKRDMAFDALLAQARCTPAAGAAAWTEASSLAVLDGWDAYERVAAATVDAVDAVARREEEILAEALALGVELQQLVAPLDDRYAVPLNFGRRKTVEQLVRGISESVKHLEVMKRTVAQFFVDIVEPAAAGGEAAGAATGGGEAAGKSAGGGNGFTLILRYKLPEQKVSWRPAYDVNFTDEGLLEIEYSARVYQCSGDDWAAAELTFATNPIHSADRVMPHLPTVEAHFPRPRPRPRACYAMRKMAHAPMMAAMAVPAAAPQCSLEDAVEDAVDESAAAPMMLMAMPNGGGGGGAACHSAARAEGAGVASRFRVPTPVTLASQAPHRQILLASFSLKACLFRLWAPTTRTPVLRVVAAVNRSDWLMLPSQRVNIRLAGVAEGLDFALDGVVAPGETLAFCLGPDPNVAGKFVGTNSFDSVTRFPSKSTLRTVESTALLRAGAQQGGKAPLVVLWPLPRAADQRISVDLPPHFAAAGMRDDITAAIAMVAQALETGETAKGEKQALKPFTFHTTTHNALVLSDTIASGQECKCSMTYTIGWSGDKRIVIEQA